MSMSVEIDIEINTYRQEVLYVNSRTRRISDSPSQLGGAGHVEFQSVAIFFKLCY
jgi:hypothetical protein